MKKKKIFLFSFPFCIFYHTFLSWCNGSSLIHESFVLISSVRQTHDPRIDLWKKELCACLVQTLVKYGVVMASGGTEELEHPASFKWEHFGFPVKYNDEGKRLVDKTVTVCRHCGTRKPYDSGKTSSMATHLKWHHPGVSLTGVRMKTA